MGSAVPTGARQGCGVAGVMQFIAGASVAFASRTMDPLSAGPPSDGAPLSALPPLDPEAPEDAPVAPSEGAPPPLELDDVLDAPEDIAPLLALDDVLDAPEGVAPLLASSDPAGLPAFCEHAAAIDAIARNHRD